VGVELVEQLIRAGLYDQALARSQQLLAAQPSTEHGSGYGEVQALASRLRDEIARMDRISEQAFFPRWEPPGQQTFHLPRWIRFVDGEVPTSEVPTSSGGGGGGGSGGGGGGGGGRSIGYRLYLPVGRPNVGPLVLLWHGNAEVASEHDFLAEHFIGLPAAGNHPDSPHHDCCTHSPYF
jgi:hypothetical protein